MSIFNLFRKKENVVTSAIIQTAPSAIFPKGSFSAFAHEYGQNPYVYACVRKIATAVSGINWIVYSKDKTQELPDSPLQKLLNRPNEFQASSAFFDEVVSYLELTGNAFVFYTGGELYVLRPDRVVVIPGKTQNQVQRYEYRVNGAKVNLDARSVIHLKLFAPDDDWRGISPLNAVLKSVVQNDSSRTWNVSLLQNSARPSGFLKTSKILSENQFERLEQRIKESYSSSANAGKPMLLEGDLNWQQLGFNPAEMEWLEGLKLSAREIAIAFGVPPELIGDASNKTYSNYQEARRSFYTETVIPLLQLLKSELNARLTKMVKGGGYIDFDKDSIEALHEDRKLVWSQAIEAVKAGILTQNEARELLGYEDIPGANSLYVSAGLLPSATAREEAKAFALRSDEEKTKHWYNVERKRNAWVRSVEKILQKYFTKEKNAVISYLQNGGTNFHAFMNRQSQELNKTLTAIYFAVGEEFARDSY